MDIGESGEYVFRVNTENSGARKSYEFVLSSPPDFIAEIFCCLFAFIDALAPVGYEDEFGFHFGVPFNRMSLIGCRPY